MPELTLLLLRLGVLVLLWLFVLAAVRVIRGDLFGPARATAAGTAPPVRAERAARTPRGRSAARRLVVTDGELKGTTITLGGAPITLGRADDSTLVLTDDYASSRHARLVPSDGAWVLEDLGSTNGTYLDRSRVTTPVPVPLGTPIRIGKTVLELRR
jgi:hypothetical protein